MADDVLIVDDSLTVRMDLQEGFELAGLETRLCASLAEARLALADRAPAAMVLDLNLPDGAGLDLLAELRLAAARLPVLLLSSEAEVADRVRGLRQGADAYIGKPYDRDHLVRRVIEIIRRQREPGRDRTLVLVIDDSMTFRERLAADLATAGHAVITAASGEEGLLRAADSRPDAIIVDGIMPDIGGAEVIRRLRLDPGLAAIPTIYLTASEGSAVEVEALDAGADAYIRKSHTSDVVVARLGAILRASGESRGAAAGSVLDPKRVLIIDDPRGGGALAAEMRADGHDTVLATTIADALQLLALDAADCIIVALGGGDGLDACRRLKAETALRSVPLLLLTAGEGVESLRLGLDAGADDCVARAGGFGVLRARVRALLRRKQIEDEHRRVHDAILRKEAEAAAERQRSEARREMAEALAKKNEELARHSRELERLNTELEAFAYSVSHDLRQPLLSMHGFAKILADELKDVLDERAQHYLGRITAAAHRMNELIEGLLSLSRIQRGAVTMVPVRLDAIAQRIFQRLAEASTDRVVDKVVARDMVAIADPRLVESLLENLLGNAWKFTSKRARARIEVGVTHRGGERVFFVRDDGAGFDMARVGRLFQPFQRLHGAHEFEGTGIGLATVQRIVQRHGGRVFAESVPEQGTTFFFTLAPGQGNP